MWNWLLDVIGSRGLDLKELARRLDVSVEELKNANLEYHQFSVRKKSGKPRQINAPNPKLKSLQRKILRRLLAKLKTHPQATGFQTGISFVDNAKCHQSQSIVIKVDLVDFFPSIKEQRLLRYFRLIGWNRKATRILTRLVTHEGQLPQGAPTSPRLSNLVNVRLDARLAGLANAYDGIYTRYADDITFSFSDDPYVDIQFIVTQLLVVIRQHGYIPHVGKKFDIRRTHQRQVVTGLVVNDRANLPRETRRWLRAVEHRTAKYRKGGTFCLPPTLTEEQLQGWRSLQRMIAESHETFESESTEE